MTFMTWPSWHGIYYSIFHSPPISCVNKYEAEILIFSILCIVSFYTWTLLLRRLWMHIQFVLIHAYDERHKLTCIFHMFDLYFFPREVDVLIWLRLNVCDAVDFEIYLQLGSNFKSWTRISLHPTHGGRAMKVCSAARYINMDIFFITVLVKCRIL